MASELEPSEMNFKAIVTYWGGYFLRPASRTGDIGFFQITNDRFVFEKHSVFGGRWKIEMPFNEIIWKRISQTTGEDVTYKQQMTAMTFLATGLPMSTASLNTTYMTIPFKDEKGIEHTPKFSFRQETKKDKKYLEQILKFIYERM